MNPEVKRQVARQGEDVLEPKFILDRVAHEVYSPGLGTEEMLRVLLEQLSIGKKYLLISLDEIDYFISPRRRPFGDSGIWSKSEGRIR